MKLVIFHPKASEAIKELAKPIRRELGEALLKLQQGMTLGLPISRAMPAILHGVHELRIKDDSGTFRIFYYVKSRQGILVFHVFAKKTQRTPEQEIGLARKRLKEMLTHE